MAGRRRNTLVGLLVGVAVAAVAAAMLVPAIVRLREQANLARCADNLRQIGVGLLAYGRGAGGNLPVSPTVENPHAELVEALVATRHAGEARSYYCPSEPRGDLRYDADRFRAGNIGYFYYSAESVGTDGRLSKFLRSTVVWPRRLRLEMDPHTWVMSDRWASGLPTSHAGYRKGVNYLAVDGSVAFVTDSPRHAFR